MKNKLLTLTIVMMLCSLNSCFKSLKTIPDETNVSKRPALYIPPKFDLPSPQEEDKISAKQKSKKNKNTLKNKDSKTKQPATPLTESDKILIQKLNDSKKDKVIDSKTENSNITKDSIDNLKSDSKINDTKPYN